MAGYKAKDCRICGKEFKPIVSRQVRCRECLEKLDPRTKTNSYIGTCKNCGKEYTKQTAGQQYCTPDCRKNNRHYAVNYGLTETKVNDKIKEQDGKCAICGDKGFAMKNTHIRTLCVDHNHKTNKVRGMLCHNCNRGLGLFKDDTKILKIALEYLNKYL